MAFLKRKQICGIDDGLTSIAIIVRYGTGKMQDAMIDCKFFNSVWVLCREPMRSSPHAHSLRESQLSALLWTRFCCSFPDLFYLPHVCSLFLSIFPSIIQIKFSTSPASKLTLNSIKTADEWRNDPRNRKRKVQPAEAEEKH